jgi:hypothetical protein
MVRLRLFRRSSQVKRPTLASSSGHRLRQDTERTRLMAKDGDEQRECGRAFSPPEKQDILKPLS